MLADIEKQECLKILDFLTLNDLVSLTDTVTGKVVAVENKQEALEAIMLYTRTGEELLKRRKVRREHLYQYLAKEGHVEHPAAEKGTLLKKVLQLWMAKKQGTESSLDLKPFVLPQKAQTSLNDKQNVEETTEATTNKTDVIRNEDDAQLLAVHFSAWFYKMLETLGSSQDWGPQHFWADASFSVRCIEPGGEQEINITGAKDISDKISSMVVGDQLHFNPNITTNSIKSKQDPHGLTIIMVCGTVHRGKQFIGIFEQTFGLIRDPSEENNWKIKFTKLILKASNPQQSMQQQQLEQLQHQGAT